MSVPEWKRSVAVCGLKVWMQGVQCAVLSGKWSSRNREYGPSVRTAFRRYFVHGRAGCEEHERVLNPLAASRSLDAEWRPTMRRFVYVTLWIVLVAQSLWMLLHRTQDLSYPLKFAMPFALLALTNGRNRWVAALMRIPLAYAFLSAVADRFGFLGPYGSKGVGWGDFAHFIAYTREVNAFAPEAVIPLLAVLATIGETTFGLGLLLGVRTREMALGAAGLLFLFATAMSLSGGLASQAEYGVYLMSAGALALWRADDPTLVSIDALRKGRTRASYTAPHAETRDLARIAST